MSTKLEELIEASQERLKANQDVSNLYRNKSVIYL
jgi:hypothetical protein